jgi:hypothetical protein
MQDTQDNSYHSFLFRLWRGQYQDKPTWCSSLETIPTEQRWAFPDLASLIRFLQTYTGDVQALPKRLDDDAQ